MKQRKSCDSQLKRDIKNPKSVNDRILDTTVILLTVIAIVGAIFYVLFLSTIYFNDTEYDYQGVLSCEKSSMFDYFPIYVSISVSLIVMAIVAIMVSWTYEIVKDNRSE